MSTRWFCVPLLGWVTAAAAADPLSFEDALRLAEQVSPALQVQDDRLGAARAAAGPAAALPDPRLVLGLDNVPAMGPDSGSFSRDNMTMQRVGIAQDFPNRAKRRARAAQGRARVDNALAARDIARLELRRDTAVAWLACFYAERRLALFPVLEHENNLLSGTVAARHAAGEATTADTLLPRQEALVLATRRDDLEADRIKARTDLARFISEAAARPLAARAPAIVLDPARLRAHLEHHPELARYEPKRAIAEARLREAEADKSPDWGMMLSYQRRGRNFDDMVSAEISIDLPLFGASRQDPLIVARARELAAVDAERDLMLRDHRAELERDLADYEAAMRRQRRIENQILPLAEQRVDLEETAYAGGRGDLAAVLAARRDRAATRLEALAAAEAAARLAAVLHYSYEDFLRE